METMTLTINEAEALVEELEKAIDEAEDHQTTMAAKTPWLDLSIHVNPHLQRTPSHKKGFFKRFFTSWTAVECDECSSMGIEQVESVVEVDGRHLCERHARVGGVTGNTADL